MDPQQPVQSTQTVPPTAPISAVNDVESAKNQFNYLGTSIWILKFGLAFVFTFAAVFMSLNPDKYMSFVPPFIQAIVPGTLFSHLFAFYEIALSIWLLSGKWLFWSALLSALTLIGIEVFNIQSFDVLFRNVAIITGALALVLLSRVRR